MGFIPNKKDCHKCDYWDGIFCVASYCIIGKKERERLKTENPNDTMTTIKLDPGTVESLKEWCDDKSHCDYGKAIKKFLVNFDTLQEKHDKASDLDDKLGDDLDKLWDNLDKIEKQLKKCLGAQK